MTLIVPIIFVILPKEETKDRMNSGGSSRAGEIFDNLENDFRWNETTSASGSVDNLPFHNSTTTTVPDASSFWDDPRAIFLYCAFFMALCFCVSSDLRRGDLIRQLAREDEERRRRRERLTDPKLRQQFISDALIVKQITDEDTQGMFTLGEPSDEEVQQQEEEREESPDNDQDSSCVICLEPFRVNDLVAWSRHFEECQHVFHRDCIESWLQKQDDCPSCRTILLQHEDDTKNSEEEEGDEQEHHLGTSTMAFVIMNGLVSRARRASYSFVSRLSFDQHDHEQQQEEEDDDDEDPLGGSYRHPPPLPTPVLLRRVFSLGDHRLKQGFRHRSWRTDNVTAYSTDSQQQQEPPRPSATAIQFRRVVSTGSPSRVSFAFDDNKAALRSPCLRRVSSSSTTGESLLLHRRPGPQQRSSSILWRDTVDRTTTTTQIPSVPWRRSVSWSREGQSRDTDEADGRVGPVWNQLLPQSSSEEEEDIILQRQNVV
jgi:hypothetical protein